MHFVQTVAVVFLCSLALAASTRFMDCGSRDGKITSLQVADCGDEPICFLKRGTNVTFVMNFTANKDIDSSNIQVTGVVGPVHKHFDLPDSNACHFMTCPVKKGGSDVFKLEIPLLASYPSVKVKIQAKLMTHGEVITCVSLLAKLV